MNIRSAVFVPMFATLILMAASCNRDSDNSAADLTMPVVVEKVQRGPISEFVSVTGTLWARQEETIVAEVQGVLQLARTNGGFLTAGTTVSQGQLLAELDNDEYLLEVRLESKRLAMNTAQRELDKQEALYEEGGVTEKELELARQNALDARLNYDAAVLKAAKLQLKAPISGVVTNFQTKAAGTQVPAGFKLCSIMDYREVSVEVNLPNSDLGRVQPGQQVNVSNYALQGDIFEGRVVSIDPTVDAQTRTFKAIVEVDNPDLQLRPGMFVKTDIIVEHHADAIVIPKVALQTRDGRPVVFVVEGVSAELREVTTGIETREEIEIVEGLSEGERLVVKGQETLRDKSKVRVTE